jgi:putative ATP-binding cassette transporter
MKLFRFLLSVSPRVVMIAVVAGVISGASMTGLIALIRRALETRPTPGVALVWSFAALCLLAPVTKFCSGVLLARLGQGAIFRLRMQLSERILAAPLRQLEEIGPSKLLATLTDDVSTISETLIALPLLCINLAILLGCLIYLASLSWAVFLLTVILIVVGIISYRLPLKRAAHFFGKARDKQDAMFEHFQALTRGTKELKLHSVRQEEFLTGSLQSTAAAYRSLNVRGMTFYIATASWGSILFFISIGIFLFLLPLFANIDPRVLIGCALIFLYLMTPLEVIVNVMPLIGRADVALRKIESLGLSLAVLPAETKTSAQSKSTPSWHLLELVGVTHAYYQEREEHNFTLGPINLTIEPGEMIFLVGGNGSGKTTFAKLVTGLYGPDSGTLYLDQRPVTDDNRNDYRQLFSVVFSDFYVFDHLLGIDAATADARALEYLSQLQLDHKVSIREGILSTTALSQGQRKRLALLTAYLEDRPIYLFDEWAADQDPLFKEVFYLRLLPELKAKGKTVIVITHDDRYYFVADRIIKLDYGKLVSDNRAVSPALESPSRYDPANV